MQKVQSMIDAYQFKTSVSEMNLIQLLEQLAIPKPKYLGLYNQNLIVPLDSEFKSNDLELSNMCGLGPNSKQINAYVGHGYMNIINGGVSTESMLYGRMAPSERIGEHKAIPLGFVEGNIAIGYTAKDQFKQRSLAATAFSTKVILVSKPGAQLNNSKMFFESMIISSLDEVKYNGITMQRLNGRCNLIPGRCIYFSIAKLLETELTIADFLNDNWLYNKYVELKTAAQSRIDISIGFDIFDINTTELVF